MIINRCEYLENLPIGCVSQVRSEIGTELMTFKKGRRTFNVGNIEPINSLQLLIRSELNGKEIYWHRLLQADHDINLYRRYIKDGNLFILWDDASKAMVNKERGKTGMTYYDYIEIRTLTILKEILENQDGRTDMKIKLRALQIEMDKIKNKYT